MNLRLRIIPKLTLVFVLFALTLVSGVSALVYSNARTALHTATISGLLSTSLEKQTALNAWVGERQKNVTTLAAAPHLKEEVAGLAADRSDPINALRVHDLVVADLLPYVEPQGVFLEIMVLDPETGEVLVSTDPAQEGKFKESLPFFINGRNGSSVQNVYYSIPLLGPAMTASAPIRSEDGRLLAVLAARINLEEMTAIIAQHTGLHESDEAFLVNTSNLFITQPRLITNPAVLLRGVHTEAVNRCLERTSGVISALDYRDLPALIVYNWLPEQQLCMIVKIDEAEALAPADALRTTILWASGLTLLAASALAYGLARGITRPIRALQEGAARFRQGDLAARLLETSRDELGELAREFNQMAASLSERDNQLRAYSLELEKRVDERTGELQQSEERFRLVNEASPNAMIMAGRDGKISFANETAISLFGYPREELIGFPIEALIPVRFRAVHPAFREGFFADAHPRPMGKGHDLFALCKDGSEVPVEIGLSPVATRDGLFTLATITDIRERKQSETILAASEIRYRRLFESAKDGIIVLDAETGLIVDVNPFLLELLGFPREEFLEKKIWELGLFKDIAANQEAFAELLRKEYIRFENLPIETSAGLRIEVEFVSYVYKMNNQKLIQCNIRNITDRVKAEIEIRRANVELEDRVTVRTQQLEFANKELEAFSYSVSHDLRAPLRAINGFSRILLEKHTGNLDAEGIRYFNLVRDNARQMGQLVDDLLAFSRLGRQPLTKVNISLGEFVPRIVDELHAEVDGRKVDFILGNLAECHADPALLKQVFVNLLSNALKFTRRREAARIEIGRESRDGETVYFVKDNGTGFDMRYADKLFGVFQRLHRAEDFEGTGVGLAIVQRIVQRHGGRVWAEAEVDKGAAFYFTI